MGVQTINTISAEMRGSGNVTTTTSTRRSLIKFTWAGVDETESRTEIFPREKIDKKQYFLQIQKHTFKKPVLEATCFALFVKSPKVFFPTYVRSSNVLLLTPAAVLLASNALLLTSCTDLDASPAARLACMVICE